MSEASQGQTENTPVKMRGFGKRSSVDEAWAWIDRQVRALNAETVPLVSAAGRVLARDVFSDVDVPGFERAMMDGFAVKSGDTAGAGPYNRLALAIVGESLPGNGWLGSLQCGQAVRIMTGALLPAGADAVLPVEFVEAQGHQVFVQDSVTPGKHVARRGEDVAAGGHVLSRGRRLRPQDIGVLSSIGIARVEVIRRPVTRVVVTGNELLPTGTRPAGTHITDANGPMLEALVQRDGGVAVNQGIVPDRPDTVLAALRAEADVILVSGGSSVGQEDHAADVLGKYGQLAIHGITMRPSSPAGMGKIGETIVFLLPGNPVSCFCAYDFFAGRAIRGLGGLSHSWPYRQVSLPLQRKLVSVVGRVDYARVKLVGGAVEPLAIGGASILSSTTRADGFVVIPCDREGYQAGTEVTVWLYD